jgi:glycosyltransferase involved in cell wall biosynthesis
MNITMICCPFQTSFGAYTNALKNAIEKRTGELVEWVASNCGCGDEIEVNRLFQIDRCRYFDMPAVGDHRSSRNWKLRARGLARSASAYIRARRYAALSKHSDVAHFHQILNSYGSKALFRWLTLPANAARIVTVHELDADQKDSPESNLAYNRANAVIVHCQEMHDILVRLGVQDQKIHIVPHGAILPALEPDAPRDGIVFYAGHKFASGKGAETVFRALALLQSTMGPETPVLKIHGHYGTVVPKEGARLAQEHGVTSRVVWLNQLPEKQICELYATSEVCVLPYSGSFAGLAASQAAACALPVVATRKAGLPDHLGDAGIWIDEDSPLQLARQIGALITDRRAAREAGAKLRKRAERLLSWEVVADRTLEIYQSA